MSKEEETKLTGEFSRWLTAAKTKAKKTAEFVAADLSELKEMVVEEAKKGLETIKDEKKLTWMKEMVSTVTTKMQFLGMEKIYLGEDEEETVETIRADDYQQWKVTFRLVEHLAEIEEAMDRDDGLRKEYLQQVPDQMEAIEFWARYFYHQKRTVVTQPGEMELSSTQEDEETKEGDKAEEGWLDWDQ